MGECTICNLCDTPRTFGDATDKANIRSNVRRFSHESFTVWRCRNCLSLHRKNEVDLDRYYADYPMRKQRMDFGTIRASHNRLKSIRRHGFSVSHTLLDYGCGSGLFVEFLRRSGFSASGYDPYVPQFAEKEIMLRQYDFITSQDVIEHVSDPRRLLHELSQRLKPGGYLFIGTPNAVEIGLNDQYSMELHQPYHEHLLSENALVGLGLAAGLDSVEFHNRFYYDTLWPMVNLQFIRRYIQKNGGHLDAGFEEPNVKLVLSSSELLFFGFFGFYFRAKGNMTIVFQRK